MMASDSLFKINAVDTTSNTASVPVLNAITAPVLSSVDPILVTKFLKEWERYVREVHSKQAEVPALKSVPYTASIKVTLLKSLFFIVKCDEISRNMKYYTQLKEEHIETFIKSLINCSCQTTYNPAVIDAFLSGRQMDMKITDPDARGTLHCSTFFKRNVESVGYGSFPKLIRKKNNISFTKWTPTSSSKTRDEETFRI